MNLVATHYNCTSPMDYISHHALHSHIPIHHYTNHTAVTIHSLALIVSPHLHLIHTHTFKQHSHMHLPRSLVLPRLTFWAFPLYCVSLCLPVFTWTAYTTLTICCLPSWPCLPCDILSVCRLPRPLHCPCCWFCPAYVTPVIASDTCLFDLALLFNKAAFESNDTASSLHPDKPVLCEAVSHTSECRERPIRIKYSSEPCNRLKLNRGKQCRISVIICM